MLRKRSWYRIRKAISIQERNVSNLETKGLRDASFQIFVWFQTFSLRHLWNEFHVEHVSHDCIIGSDFQNNSHIISGFFIDPNLYAWKKHSQKSYLISSSYSNMNSLVDSMGGHGALVSYLKNPGAYCSVSAFAPICNPVDCPWGQKAFAGYLGDNKDAWKVCRISVYLKDIYMHPYFDI